MRTVKIGKIRIGAGNPLALIAGSPCVIESRKHCLQMAARRSALAATEKIPLIFKASYDKANRSSHASFRGPGLIRGLEILRGGWGTVRTAGLDGSSTAKPKFH